MKSNRITAWAILAFTILVPFKMAYLNDDASNMGVKILMMILTMAGVIASLFIGLGKAGEH